MDNTILMALESGPFLIYRQVHVCTIMLVLEGLDVLGGHKEICNYNCITPCSVLNIL